MTNKLDFFRDVVSSVVASFIFTYGIYYAFGASLSVFSYIAFGVPGILKIPNMIGWTVIPSGPISRLLIVVTVLFSLILITTEVEEGVQ